MNRKPNPTIPPNFVSLRMLKELKEKREEDERLKREEDERLKREEEELKKKREEEEERLKREEEERVRKLREKEEQERIRRFKEEEEEYLKNRLKTIGSKKPYGRNFRRDAQPKARLSGEARSIPDSGANGDANAVPDGRSKPPRRTNPEARKSDLERRAAATGGGSYSKPLSLDESKKEKKKEKKKANRRLKKEASKEREGEMTKMPLGLNGSTAPMIEKESEITKASVDGSGTIKVSGGERWRHVKVIGPEPSPIAEVKKGVSDLKMGRGNPDPNRRGRGRGYGGRSWGGGRPAAGSFGRGRGDGGMMWVKKTTEA